MAGFVFKRKQQKNQHNEKVSNQDSSNHLASIKLQNKESVRCHQKRNHQRDEKGYQSSEKRTQKFSKNLLNQEEMEVIRTQKEFDQLALQECEANNGNNSEDCTENWKAGYLYALKQLYDFRESQNYEDGHDYMNKTDEKIDEFVYLEIISE